MSGIELTKEVLVLPEGMEIDHWDLHHFALSVIWRGARTDTGRGGYGVLSGSRQLSRAGNWGHPDPYQQHQYRWESLEEALEMARRHVGSHKVNGHTWAEWQAILGARASEDDS